MKSDAKRTRSVPEMPFQVDHKLSVNIATQVTDGIRQAILSGFYKPGDLLPKALDFTRGLHVSIRATQAAYRTLKKEGLISPRRRLGTVVVGPKADVFHGRVVIVKKCSDPLFSDTVTSEVLTRRLNEAGYVVASVLAIPLGGRGHDPETEHFDLRQLNAALRQNASLVVIIGTAPPLERAVAATGTPYFIATGKPRLAIGRGRPGTSGCVGSASGDASGVLPDVLGRLRERNVRSLVQIGIRQRDLLDSDALRAACESYEELVCWPRLLKHFTQEDIVRAAYDFFRERYRTKADLPDAFLFTDDYLTHGALTALLGAGIRTGRDVLVVTVANKGARPLLFDPIDLILRDPVHDANTIADALIAYLDTGAAPGTIRLESTFVADGEVVR